MAPLPPPTSPPPDSASASTWLFPASGVTLSHPAMYLPDHHPHLLAETFTRFEERVGK